MNRRSVVCGVLACASAAVMVAPALAFAHAPTAHVRPVEPDRVKSGRDWLANWTAICAPYVMTAKMDPIVFPGVPAGPDNPSHLHQFFGNKTISLQGDSTPASLMADQSTDCIGPLDPANPGGPSIVDGSSYWTPALFVGDMMSNHPLIPTAAHIYYRNGGVDPALVHPFPANLEMIGGNAHAVSPQSGTVEWSCSPDTGLEQVGADQVPGEYRVGPTIPEFCPKVDDGGLPFDLKLTVYFKNCLRPAPHAPVGNDTSRLSYPISVSPHSGMIDAVCPPGTEAIPQVSVVVRWHLNAAEDIPARGKSWDLRSLSLASDGMDGAGIHGTTAHADFMNGWLPADIADLTTHCFAPPFPHNCGI